jgi:hypothetical protein
MSCRHGLAIGTCKHCYPITGIIDPGPESDYEPNLKGPETIPADQEALTKTEPQENPNPIFGKDVLTSSCGVYPTGNWFLLCTQYDDFTNPRSGGGAYLDKIQLDAKDEASAGKEAKSKWSELTRYETGFPKEMWPQNPKLIYVSSEKIE